MSKYFLIHGYGKALDIGESSIPQNAGFYTFDTEITQEEAYPFVWSLEYPRKRLRPFLPQHQLRLYFRERSATESLDLQMKLREDIDTQQPQIIIAHSLGARLLHSTLLDKDYILPPSVSHILLCQADIPQWKYQSNKISVHSFYCWWDIALWSSASLSLSIPIGLFPLKQDEVHHWFRGLYRGWNLHQDIWRDGSYKKDILNKIQS